MDAKMFCYQCQETAGGKGCTMQGVCGKKPDVAEMQDLLVYVTKGLGAVTTALRAEGKSVSIETNHRVTMNLFVTLTNANFEPERCLSSACGGALDGTACRVLGEGKDGRRARNGERGRTKPA